ncbi:hypothetical protein EPN52_11800 [bacterium]|nr:MAG: hypothetical protein EPN52_11800 [bacterium]
MQYVILAKHSPEHCPTSNAQVRALMKEGAQRIPDLARKLGLNIITIRVFGPDHIVMAIVESASIEAVRDFMFESRLIQWNTSRIHATYSMEEALAKSEALPVMF